MQFLSKAAPVTLYRMGTFSLETHACMLLFKPLDKAKKKEEKASQMM
jgi:hypothetical protein